MERLRCFGIDTRYEQTLTFGDEVIAPDFTFEGADSFDRRGTIDMTMIDFIIRNEIIPRL